ncbi:hypothetical protein WG66_014224 [Moniliophthora roreri]|nr:hypothetical protein WG66_014224 [Moniliophthora roreri]
MARVVIFILILGAYRTAEPESDPGSMSTSNVHPACVNDCLALAAAGIVTLSLIAQSFPPSGVTAMDMDTLVHRPD